MVTDATCGWLMEVDVDLRNEAQWFYKDVLVISERAILEGFFISTTPKGQEVGRLVIRDGGTGQRPQQTLRAVIVRALTPAATTVPLPAGTGRLVGRLETKAGVAWYAWTYAVRAQSGQAERSQAQSSAAPSVVVAPKARAVGNLAPVSVIVPPPSREVPWFEPDASQASVPHHASSATTLPRTNRTQ